MEEFNTLYFTWEEGPAVLEPVENGDIGFFITPGESNWMLATPRQVADFLLTAQRCPKQILKINLAA